MLSYFWSNKIKVFRKNNSVIDIRGTYFKPGANLSPMSTPSYYKCFDRSETILCVCLPGGLWMLLWGDGGSRSGPRNSPSCSSAMSDLTLRDKEPGFMSGRLTSPDSSRLKATSARQISCTNERTGVQLFQILVFISAKEQNKKKN